MLSLITTPRPASTVTGSSPAADAAGRPDFVGGGVALLSGMLASGVPVREVVTYLYQLAVAAAVRELGEVPSDLVEDIAADARASGPVLHRLERPLGAVLRSYPHAVVGS